MKDLHGIHIPGHKNTSAMKAAKLPLPQSVVIPMAMHIGAPARPVVKVGDHVKTGQLSADLREHLRHGQKDRRHDELDGPLDAVRRN